MPKENVTDRMVNALSALEKERLSWTQKNNSYFWATEEGNPSNILIKTILMLENKGFVAVVYQTDHITVNITDAGKKFLKEKQEEKLKEQEERLKAKEIEVSFKEEIVKTEIPKLLNEENICAEEEEAPEEEKVPEEKEASEEEETSKEEEYSDEEDPLSVQMLPSTVYLVDSENVGNTWLGLINRLQEEDELHVFYTDKSPTLSYETVVQLLKHDYIGMVNWIRCFTGDNALDFQLVTELGSMIAENKCAGIFDTYFIILSKDTGYDPVVSYWAKKGVMIKRYAAYTDIRDELIGKEKKLDENSAKESKNRKDEQYQVNSFFSDTDSEKKKPLRGKKAISALDDLLVEKTWKEKLEDFFEEGVQAEDPKAAAEYLIEMSRIIDVNNEEKYLHAVSTQFGEEKGNIIMEEIQSNKFLRVNLSNGATKNLKVRRKDYIMLFLRNNEFLDPDIRSIAPLLQKPSNVQIENIKRLLLRYHNGAETQKLINLIEDHLKIVKEII